MNPAVTLTSVSVGLAAEYTQPAFPRCRARASRPPNSLTECSLATSGEFTSHRLKQFLTLAVKNAAPLKSYNMMILFE